MAWNPNPNQVGDKEAIGRRIYDEPMLAGATDQNPFAGIQVRHFEETRDREVSLDRCGATGAERGVLGYLFPRARAMGEALGPPKKFSGWLSVPAIALRRPSRGPAFPPIASPQPGEGLAENKYHAHVTFPDGIDDHYIVALLLRNIFAIHGKPITSNRGKTTTSNTVPPP